MYPVPATPRAYHPIFTRDIVQAVLVVPQERAIVNSKPYPACLFSRRGRPSTDAPGVQISILQRRLSVSSRKIWHPAPSAQPQAVWGGDFKFGVSGSASGRVPQKHIGCAVTRQQTTHRLAVGRTYAEDAPVSRAFGARAKILRMACRRYSASHSASCRA